MENMSYFSAVCSFCFHNNKNAKIEFNFKEICIYYICPECKKINKIDLNLDKGKGLPKIKIL